VFQCCFYLLKYRERADVCYTDTNCIEWKKSKLLLAKNQVDEEDLFTVLGGYYPFSAKDDEYKEYNKLVFIKDNLESMQEADVDEYSIALGQLMRLLKLAVELRIDNVKERRGLKKKQREDRQDCIDKEAERVNRRSEEM